MKVSTNVSKPGKKPITSQRKRKARAMRSSAMPGTNSTHLMESGEADGRHVVNPTIFPNKDGSWKDLTDKGNEAYNEATKRGEVFSFRNKKRAEKFAHGSWKKGRDKREAMKDYRANKRAQGE